METLQAISERRSVRRFLDIPVENEKLGIILEAGRDAPSAGNLQTWKFIVIKNQKAKEKIADLCYDQYWIQKAPVLIVVVADIEKTKKYYAKRGERLYSIQNCAAAAMNMLLAAHDQGLASAWVGAFREEQLSKLLEIPEGKRPQVIIPLGYADEKPKRPLRYIMEHCVYFEGYGKRTVYGDYDRGHYANILSRKIQEAKEKTRKLLQR